MHAGIKNPKPLASRFSRLRERIARFHAGEDGQINLVTAVVMLGFAVLIGLIGNAGNAVKKKIELQNAADATAYSSSLWMARGMNAVTTTNHLMGEATATVVVFHALGGTELGDETDVSASAALNEGLETTQSSAPIATGMYDKSLVDFIVNQMTDDEGKHDAHATILDGKLTLKFGMNLIFGVKTLANAGLIPNPAYAFTAPAAIAAHIAMDVLAVKLMQEWFFLEFLEQGIKLVNQSRFVQTIEEQVIPILSQYGDYVAGKKPGFGGGSQLAPVNRSIKQTFSGVTQRYRLTAAAIHPDADDLRLPIREEPAPPSGSTRPGSEWSGNDWPRALRTISDAFRQIKRLLDRANDIIEVLLAPVGWLGKVIGQDITDKLIPIPRIDLPAGPGEKGYSDNPSYDGLPEIDVEEARRSQWARATYPVVNSLRSPIRGFFRKWCRISNAPTWFTHWSNRYTLAISHRIRTSDKKPHMYVMRDMRPKQKGNEPWTRSTSQGKRRAERYFTVIAIVHRKRETAIIGPSIFKNPAKRGTFAVAQAMFYNANGRAANPANGRYQPKTGWDTLNWAPPFRAPEWGDHQPATGGGGFPRFFISGKNATAGSRVKLNWQAKLVPVTSSRLRDAEQSSKLSQRLRQEMGRIRKHARHLLSH